jgi:hypothetical protein
VENLESRKQGDYPNTASAKGSTMEWFDPDKVHHRLEQLRLSVKHLTAAAQERARESEVRVQRARNLLAASTVILTRFGRPTCPPSSEPADQPEDAGLNAVGGRRASVASG